MNTIIIEFGVYALFIVSVCFIIWLTYNYFIDDHKGTNWRDDHEHDFCIPYNTHGLKFMKCKHCELLDDITDHTNYAYEKNKRECALVRDVYSHNKPIWDLSNDLFRRMAVIRESPLAHKFKMDVYNQLKKQEEDLSLTLRHLNKTT